MANVEHSALTGNDLHEPKAIAGQAAGKVYVSDGSNSGAWASRQDIITGHIVDVSTAEVVHVPMPFAGTVSKVVTVLEGAITGSDAVVTVKNSSGTAMSPTLTIATASSAAGDVDILAPSTNNTVAVNTFITVETNGGSTGTRKLRFAVVVDRSS